MLLKGIEFSVYVKGVSRKKSGLDQTSKLFRDRKARKAKRAYSFLQKKIFQTMCTLHRLKYSSL